MQRYIALFLWLTMLNPSLFSQENPLKIGVAGLTHTHVHWILGREDIGDIEIVGIAEPKGDVGLGKWSHIRVILGVTFLVSLSEPS